MKTIQVFDPPLCCSTGVCGPEVDPALPQFAAFLSQLAGTGVRVERYNLAQQPLAFVQNSAVKALLDRAGADALPAVLLDGEIVLTGRYPTAEERIAWFQRATSSATP